VCVFLSLHLYLCVCVFCVFESVFVFVSCVFVSMFVCVTMSVCTVADENCSERIMDGVAGGPASDAGRVLRRGG
jgi:hypothetical protein